LKEFLLDGGIIRGDLFVAAERILLWMTTDPRGLSIALAADVWDAIPQKHKEMQQFLGKVVVETERQQG
jgi:hypothetical protein